VQEHLLLERPRNLVRHPHQCGEQDTHGLSEPQSGSQKAEGGSVVHGSISDIEREASDTGIHKNAEVVTEISTGDTERPHTCDNESVAGDEEGDRKLLRRRREQDVERWLLPKRLLVEIVADYAQSEDEHSEEVAAIESVAAKESGEDLVVVFLTCNDAGRTRVLVLSFWPLPTASSGTALTSRRLG
jgi:hypothetical protein